MSFRELCLDANVFVSALVPNEEAHESSLELISLICKNQIPLFEPALVVFEVASALHRKTWENALTKKEKMELLNLFFELPLLLQWQPPLIKKTALLASTFLLKRIYDCSYFAIAQSRGIPLVTLDGEFTKKASRIYEAIYSPKSILVQIGMVT